MQRGATAFLYVGNEEIGAFKKGEAEELKIPGLGAPIAIEVHGKPYAPITDAQGTIRILVDWKSGKVAQQNGCDAFGAGLSEEIPYAYAGKRYDPKTGLVYFGQRYYDPSIRRWLTPDPLGPVDHSNLYQYVFNNPYRYVDPDGQFAFVIPLLYFGAELALPTLSALALSVLDGIVIGAITAVVVYEVTDSVLQVIQKNTEVYAPDRPLPKDKDGIPIPDTDAPHTQLGTRGSKRRPGEKYAQAREFGEHGKPVKSIDFTDHGEPHIHPNPHEHPYEVNPTGGTPQRGDPRPLESWKYE